MTIASKPSRSKEDLQLESATSSVTILPSSPLAYGGEKLNGNGRGIKPITYDPASEGILEPGALYPADSLCGWYYAVLPTFMTTFVVCGFGYSWGVYQRYYLSGPYEGTLSTAAMSFVGSLSVGTLYILGPFVGKIIERYGVRIPLLVGTIFTFLGFFLTAFLTAPWQLFLTQGLLCGIGGSFCFYATILLPSQWFRKRRGLAGGIAYSGSGVGGVFFSTLSRSLLRSLGHEWTMRIVAIISLVILLASTFIARERFPSGHGYVRKAAFIELSILKDRTCALLALIGFLCCFGFLGPFFFTPSYATFLGIASSDADSLLIILSAVSAVGRVGLGFVADRIGKLNSFFICTFVGGLICMVYWPFAKDYSSLAGFMAMYGVFGGGFASLLPVTVAMFMPPEKLANAIGVIFFVQGIGLYFGTLIAAAILDSTRPNLSYIPAMMYCGSLTVGASLIILVLRLYHNRRLFTVI